MTCDGIQKFAKESHSPNAVKHKEDILALIHEAQAQLQATTTVETRPIKKQRAAATKRNDGAIAKPSSDDDEPVEEAQKDSDDGSNNDMAMVCHTAQEIERILPMVRAKNMEEREHAQNMIAFKDAVMGQDRMDREEKLKFEDSLIERDARRKAEELKHKEAMQQQDLMHEDGLIEREARRVKLEHEKRLIVDTEYRIEMLKQTEATAAAEKAEKEAAEAKDKANKEDAEAKELQLAASAEAKAKADAKTASNAARGRKAAETRREKAADASLKHKLQEYIGAQTVAGRLVLEPCLHKALRESMPDDEKREAFIKTLGQNDNTAAENKNQGVYVIGFDGLPFSRYVGYSEHIEARIEKHRNGSGAACLKGATNIVRLPQIASVGHSADSWEREETLTQMFLHGVDNVRGWHYCTPTALFPTLRQEAVKNICSHRSLCVRCGGSGHFVKDCLGKLSGWMR